MNAEAIEIESPCQRVCQLDHAGKHCIACRRTLEEIAQWRSYSPERRRQILADLPTRRPVQSA